MIRILTIVTIFLVYPVATYAETSSPARPQTSGSTQEVKSTSSLMKARDSVLSQMSSVEKRRAVQEAASVIQRNLTEKSIKLRELAATLKIDIEAYTRRGVDADKERARFEKDLVTLENISDQIATSSKVIAGLDPKDKAHLAEFKARVRAQRDSLRAVIQDFQEIIIELRLKSDALGEAAASDNPEPAPPRHLR